MLKFLIKTEIKIIKLIVFIFVLIIIDVEVEIYLVFEGISEVF